MTASTNSPGQSNHERVMADPRLRHAYIHTTDAFLRASPDHRDTEAIRSA